MNVMIKTFQQNKTRKRMQSFINHIALRKSNKSTTFRMKNMRYRKKSKLKLQEKLSVVNKKLLCQSGKNTFCENGVGWKGRDVFNFFEA